MARMTRGTRVVLATALSTVVLGVIGVEASTTDAPTDRATTTTDTVTDAPTPNCQLAPCDLSTPLGNGRYLSVELTPMPAVHDYSCALGTLTHVTVVAHARDGAALSLADESVCVTSDADLTDTVTPLLPALYTEAVESL